VVANNSVPIVNLTKEIFPFTGNNASVYLGPYRLMKNNRIVRTKRTMTLNIEAIELNEDGADLAMVKVTANISINSHPHICLPDEGKELDTSSRGTIVQRKPGKRWIRNYEDLPLTNTNDEKCWPKSKYPDFWFCFGQDSHTFSQGVTGGPVMVKTNKRTFLAGIISGGLVDDFKGPGIAVNIYTWRNWVNVKASKDGEYCQETIAI